MGNNCTTPPEGDEVVLTLVATDTGERTNITVRADASTQLLRQRVATCALGLLDVEAEEIVLKNSAGTKLGDDVKQPLEEFDIRNDGTLHVTIDEELQSMRVGWVEVVHVSLHFVDTGETQEHVRLGALAAMRHLKKPIWEVSGVACDLLQECDLDVLFGGVLIEDHESLQDVNVQEGAVLYVRAQTTNLVPTLPKKVGHVRQNVTPSETSPQDDLLAQEQRELAEMQRMKDELQGSMANAHTQDEGDEPGYAEHSIKDDLELERLAELAELQSMKDQLLQT